MDNLPSEIGLPRTKSGVFCPIAVQASRHAESPAVISDSNIWTYGQLNDLICSEVIRWQSAPKKIVALSEWNSASLIVTLFAAWRVGSFVVLFNPKLPDSTVLKIADSVGAQPISVTKELRIGMTEGRQIDSIPPGKKRPDLPQINPQALATAMLTSGSSGEPKLIVHSIANHLASAKACAERLEIGPGSDWLWSLPSFHAGGLAILWRCFTAGAAVRMMPHQTSLVNQLKSAPPTIVSLVPTQLNDLVEAKLKCPVVLQDVIVGGAPLSPSLLKAGLKLGYPIRTTYGSTETSSMVTLSNRWVAFSGELHAGLPLEGNTLEIGSGGRLSVQSESVSVGEFFRGVFVPRTITPGKTAMYETQDHASVLTSGEICILSRTDDIIISGGENISLVLVENTLMLHPLVYACTTVGVEHPRFGMRPVAFVRLVEDTSQQKSSINADEHRLLMSFLADKLPSYARPDYILAMPNLPDGALKITRVQLQQIATLELKLP